MGRKRGLNQHRPCGLVGTIIKFTKLRISKKRKLRHLKLKWIIYT
jgi:hypothetical protein